MANVQAGAFHGLMRPVAQLQHGPYRAQACKIGDVLTCAVRGRVVVAGFSDAPVGWPMTRRPTGRGGMFVIVCGDLITALRQESRLAIMHAWGVSHTTAAAWRKAVGVGKSNPKVPPHVWTAAEDALLGTTPDDVLAERFGCGRSVVRARRVDFGIKPYRKHRPKK